MRISGITYNNLGNTYNSLSSNMIKLLAKKQGKLLPNGWNFLAFY